jgi:hypothetical protein
LYGTQPNSSAGGRFPSLAPHRCNRSLPDRNCTRNERIVPIPRQIPPKVGACHAPQNDATQRTWLDNSHPQWHHAHQLSSNRFGP